MLTRLILFLCLTVSSRAFSQNIDKLITVQEVERIEKKLASDEMYGRKAGSAGIEKAADFIAEEFKAAGLQPVSGSTSFKQQFIMVEPQTTSVAVTINNVLIPEKNVIVFSPKENINLNQASAIEKASIAKGSRFGREATSFVAGKKDLIVFVDSSFSSVFPRLSQLKGMMFSGASTVIFILGNGDPASFEVKASQQVNPVALSNVVGMIPGNSRKDEYVIFSGHYDHLGIGEQTDGDSIFNGANDDAAGTAAVIMLARYFKAIGGNERTLIFATFTAEEVGGYGSQFFSRQFQPEKVVAMFNIEMIGTESKWGKNSAYITGYEKSDMGKILESNLKGSSFTFYPDPYKEQDLFYRSDNATLARLGVPAHTISTSKMDNEPYYHTVNDEVETLDMANMASIIKAIALSSKSIIAGKDTPSRVDPTSLSR